MRLLKMVAVVGVVGLAIGFTYFAFFRPVECRYRVEHPYLKVVAELATTRYQVGEEITVKLYLINTNTRPITVFGGHPLLSLIVYDALNRRVLSLPDVYLPILREYTLSPGVPYQQVYTFTLDRPRRYKLVASADFSLDKFYAQRLSICADPVRIQVVTRSN